MNNMKMHLENILGALKNTTKDSEMIDKLSTFIESEDYDFYNADEDIKELITKMILSQMSNVYFVIKRKDKNIKDYNEDDFYCTLTIYNVEYLFMVGVNLGFAEDIKKKNNANIYTYDFDNNTLLNENGIEDDISKALCIKDSENNSPFMEALGNTLAERYEFSTSFIRGKKVDISFACFIFRILSNTIGKVIGAANATNPQLLQKLKDLAKESTDYLVFQLYFSLISGLSDEKLKEFNINPYGKLSIKDFEDNDKISNIAEFIKDYNNITKEEILNKYAEVINQDFKKAMLLSFDIRLTLIYVFHLYTDSTTTMDKNIVYS